MRSVIWHIPVMYLHICVLNQDNRFLHSALHSLAHLFHKLASLLLAVVDLRINESYVSTLSPLRHLPLVFCMFVTSSNGFPHCTTF